MLLTREIVIQNRYLNMPVKNGAPKIKMSFIVRNEIMKKFNIELADYEPDFWVFSDVSKLKGESLTIQIEDSNLNADALESIVQSDSIKDGQNLYKEKFRPQFHFTSLRGWNNDPNGLVYYDGEYHLFYQHNPYGTAWGNMHWGHAVSMDLVHWKELPDALEPDKLGTIFSGSAVVDWDNTTSFQTGKEMVLICIYTSAGGTSEESGNYLGQGQRFAQSIAYSNDKGRTWVKYENNPVLGHIIRENRDPKVFWHSPSQRWVMALFLDENDYGLFSSTDLKEWQQICKITIPGASECPDMFELPVDGNSGSTKWIFLGANGSYLLGSFDGKVFQQEKEGVQRLNWGSSYAAQSWSDVPYKDGRRVQIAWLQVNMPNMPFNQQMTFPCELTLRTTEEGILFSSPVKEIEKLHDKKHVWKDVSLSPGENLLNGIQGELFDIRAEFQVGEATEFGFIIRGIPVVYDVRKKELCCLSKSAPLAPMEGKIRLQLLVDRASIEIFGNDGRVAMPIGVILEDGKRLLEVYSKGGRTRINSLEVHELRSAWIQV